MELDQKRESDQRRRRKEVRAGKAEPNPITRSHRDSLGLPRVSPGTYPVSELQRGKEELLQALAHPPHDYKSQESCVFRGSGTWTNLHCFPRIISKELDWKKSSAGLNQRPYGMLVLKTMDFDAMPQSRAPCLRFFYVSLLTTNIASISSRHFVGLTLPSDTVLSTLCLST